MNSDSDSASTTGSNGAKNSLERGLKGRHVQLIALGGAIGTGLFYGSATTIQLAGPSVSLGYLIGGMVVFVIMRALGEMAVEEPVSGSFSAYAQKYLGRFAGFFTGWTYWFLWIVVDMAEITAFGVYMKYWIPGMPQWLSALVALVIITTVNLFQVKSFGEFEFWLASILLFAMIIMIILGISILAFGLGHGATIANLWTQGGFFPHGGFGFLSSLVLVVFAFGGTELVGITAGEAQNPKQTIPSAINQVIWRILIFYVGSIAVITMLSPWNELGTKESPFVLIFQNIGIPAASSILNCVVIIASLSAFNSGLYGTARMLLNLSENGQAPHVFQKLNKGHTPYTGILFSAAILLIGVILNYVIPAKVFVYVSSVATIAVIMIWILILITQLRFRQYHINNGTDKAIAFRLFAWPFSTYVALAVLGFIIVMMGFLSGTRVALYVAPAWLAIVCLGYYLNYKMLTSRMVVNKTEKVKG